jgi:hydroxymethylbilane synthase
MPVTAPIRLERGHQLALYQATTVAGHIARAGGPSARSSSSRRRATPAGRPLSEVGGKRLFVKEIEDALLGMPSICRAQQQGHAGGPADGLTIAGVLPREDPHDAVVPAAPRSDPAAGQRSPESPNCWRSSAMRRRSAPAVFAVSRS